tara:strand:+ start:6506 stop:7207 length:702 start_codon:yes stop_codon:yes gene_type:complete
MYFLFTHLVRILSLFIPLLIAFTLVVINVRFAVNSLPLQVALFERNNISALSNFSSFELKQIAIQIQNYFSGDSNALFVTLKDRYGGQNLFTANEVTHMADVKNLFLFFFTLQNYAVIAILITAVLLYISIKSKSSVVFAKWLTQGGLITFCVILLIGFISIVAFDPLFTLFHYIGFPQGNWAFNPRTSVLVQIFPLGFWRDITLVIAGLSISEALILIGIGQIVQRIGKSKN